MAHGFSYDTKSRLKDSFPFGGIVAELPREIRRYLTQPARQPSLLSDATPSANSYCSARARACRLCLRLFSQVNARRSDGVLQYYAVRAALPSAWRRLLQVDAVYARARWTAVFGSHRFAVPNVDVFGSCFGHQRRSTVDFRSARHCFSHSRSAGSASNAFSAATRLVHLP